MWGSDNMNDCIVVTGIGIVSPLGIGIDAFWESLTKGKDGLSEITLFDSSDMRCRIAAQVDFDPAAFLGKKGLKYLDRTTRLVGSAASLALSSAALSHERVREHEVGLILGTTFGSMDSISRFDQEALKEGSRYVNPMAFPNTVMNSPAGHTAIRFGLTGINSTVSSGSVSSLQAIRCAVDYIRAGQAEILLAGGVEELCPAMLMALDKMKLLSDRRETAVPFEMDRTGFLPGEGSALLVLETLEHAKLRKARIYGRLLGFGTSYEASHMGPVRAMELALQEADLSPSDIQYLCAAANGSVDSDAWEAQAIRKVWGDQASSISIGSIKSMLGETLGASGAFQTASSFMTLNHGIVPPTVYFQKCDPQWQLNGIRNHPWKQDTTFAMINCIEHDGNCASLLIGRLNDNGE